jgi:hypothetical protein
MEPGVLRVKLLPHSLIGLSKTWYEDVPEKRENTIV